MDLSKYNNLLFLDTETTGFSNTRMCQIGMIMTDNKGNMKSQLCALVKPDGWVIDDGAYNVHGISTEECEAHGWPISVVMGACHLFISNADLIVAHNSSFDKRVLGIEAHHNIALASEGLINTKEWYCTQQGSRDLCKIPPTDKMRKAKRTSYKAPKLEEALYILTIMVLLKVLPFLLQCF